MFKARTVKAGTTGTGSGAFGSKRRREGRREGWGGLMLAGPVVTVLCVAALPAAAGPRGERVVRGEASFNRQGRNTTITASDRAIIEYDSFNIGRRQSVEFIQPGANARVMNRITGGDPTAIRGSLKSNGIIYIVNPAGVIFGPNSVINVGGMYAAAATISDQDFVQGNDHFTNVQGRVVNHGSITGDSTVALIGRRVANFGSVVADTGTVTMVAGDEVWIGERNGHIYARFSTDAARDRVAGGVENHGTIVADQMMAGVGDYFALALFEPSAVRARIAQVRGGTGTTTIVSGTIDVSDQSAGGVGGQVTITGERVALRDAHIDASGAAGGGSVRVGGDYQGRGDIPNAERTFVSQGTIINADATQQGDGGRVIVWSDVFTNYNGSITARGGAQGGDGGFAEVSGKESLAFNGRANLGAAAGDGGMLLLDPKNITIEDGGNANVLNNNEFGEAQGNNRSMDASDIVAILNTGTDLTLQANNDIVIDEAITANNAGGDGGDFTLQAGRSIEINQNVTTDNGAFTATANETVANGVIDAERDDGAATITMADGVSINAGSGNVSLTVSTGAGLTAAGALSGNLVVEDITTTGTVTLTNNGPAAGSSIVVEATGPDSLITAGNLVLVVGGAGGGGSIGATAGQEIAFTATNVEASGQAGGIFLDTAGAVNVGGASGGLTGLSTSGGGEIELTGAAVTISEAIASTGALDVTGTTVGISANVSADGAAVLTGPVTINGSRTISAGTGTLDFVDTVTMSGAGASVLLVATPNGATPGVTFQDDVTPDAGGTVLAFETPGDAVAFNIATGNGDILGAVNGVDQLQNGFTSITFGRATQATNISMGAATFLDPLVVRTTSGNINLGGALAGTGNASITLTPGAASRVALNSAGAAITTAGGAITINGNVRVGQGLAVTIASGGGNIDVAGTVDGTNAGTAESITFNAGAGTLDVDGIGAGQALDLEDATITNAAATTLGTVDLTGDLVTTNALTGAFHATGSVDADAITLNGTTFDFDGAVTSGAGGGAGAFTIGSTAATTLNFDSTVTGGSGGIDLTGTTQTFDALVSTTGGGDVDLDGSAITLSGGITTAGANGNVILRNSGLLSIAGDIDATGSVTQTNNGGLVGVSADVTGLGVTFNSATTVAGSREISATTGALAFNSTLAFTGGGSTATLTGSTIGFGGNVTGAVGGGGTNLVLQSPDANTDFGVGTGTANQMISSASLAFLQNGFTSIVFGRANASHDIDIAGVSFADPVTFRTTTAGDITLSGLLTGTDDATVLLDTSAANRIILDVTGNAIVTAGDLVNLSGMVRVAEGEDAVIDSNGGTIRFGGAVDGTTGGGGETLTLDAGAGLIDFQTVASAVSGSLGAADATGLTDLTFTDAGNVDLQSVAITGTLTATNAITGELQALGTVEAGVIAMQADTLDFDAAVTGGTVDVAANTSVNFDSSVEATTGPLNITGGSVTIDGDAISNNQDIGIVGTQITLGGDVLSGGGAISLVGPVRLAQAATTEVNSGGGLIFFGGAIDGTAGGAAETLTLNAGAGAIDLQTNPSAISGSGGVASATGLTTLTIVDAGNVDIQSVAITGAFTTSNGLNGTFDAAGAVSAGTIDLVGNDFSFDSTVSAGAGGLGVSGGGALTFGAAVSTSASGTVTLSGTNITLVSTLTTVGANSDVSITNSGLLDLGGVVLVGGSFTQVNNATGTVTIGDDMTTVGDMAFGSPVTIDAGGDAVLTSGGLMSFASTLDMNGNDLTLASDDLDFDGGANSVSNSGAPATLSLSPADDDEDIDLGDLGGNARVGAWSLDNSDLTALDASVGSLGFGNAATGEHLIFVGLITALNFDAALNAPAAGGEIRLFNNITTAGSSLTFNGEVRINNTASVTIDTGGGDVSFLSDVFGSTTGGAESLTVDAGTGDIDFDSFIAGQSTGVSNTTGLTTVTLIGDNVTIEAVDISGALGIDNASILSVNDDVDADGGFIQTNATVSGTSAVTLSGDITTVNNDIEFASDVTQTGDSVLSAGTGSIDLGSALTFDTGGNDLTLAARDIDIQGTLTGGDGTNTLTLRPDAVGTAIEIGTGTSLNAGALVLTGADISNIDDGFAGIEIGFAGTGAHDFEIGTAAFTDPLTLHAPGAGGSFTIVANRTLSGTGDASLRFNGSHSTLTLNNGSRITTAGTDIEIDDDVLLADGAGDSGLNADIPLISSGGGDITIDGSIRGTDNASGDVERLRIAAGTGLLVVGDALTVNGTTTNIFGALDGGLNPVASAEGLVDFSIVSAGGVTIEGVDIAGALETETALTGAFTANGAVATQSISMSGTSISFVDGFAATNNGGGTAAFINSGAVTTTTGEATGSITTTGDLQADTLLATGSLDVGGDLGLDDEALIGADVTVAGATTVGDRIVAGNNVTLTGDVLFSTNGLATDRGLFAGNALALDGGLDTGGQDTTLAGNEINFNGGARSITGGGALTIEPGDAARDINLGSPVAGNPTGTSLDLTDNDLAAIDDGFDSVTIGIVGGTHDLVFGTSTFRNRMVFNYQSGTALVQGNVFGAGNASFEFLGADSGGTTLAANITTADGGILIDDNVTLGGNSTLSNSGGAGTIEIDGTLDGGFDFTALGGAGEVEIDGVVGGATPLSSLTLTADSVTLFNGIGTPGAAGVTGLTQLTGTSTLTLGGETYNTNEAIYATSTTGNILGAGSGSTATFTTNNNDISFVGGGTFDIDDGVDLVINTGTGSINLGAGFTGSAGAMTFSSAVVLLANTQITNQGTGPGATITFESTVDGPFDLEVTTAGGDIDFRGDIGSADPLANLDVDSAAGVLLENMDVTGNATIVASDGDITYNGTQYEMGSGTFAASGQHSVVSGATAFTTRGGDITFGGGDIVLTDGSDLTVSTDGGDATFTAIRGDSDEDLSVDLGAGTGFFEAIGSGDEIGDIVLRMNNIALNGDVFGNTIAIEPGGNSRNIEIAGDGSLPAAMRISRVEFARLRDGFTSVTIGREGAEGSIVVGGDGGGAISFDDPLTLLSPESLGSVVIQEDLNGAGDPGVTPASLTIDAGSVLLSSAITTEGEDVTITGATAVGADASITTDGGDILFADGSTINSPAAASLTLDAGTGDVTVTGDIGGVNPLGSVNFTGAAVAVQAVATEGDQTYTGAVTLNGNLDAADGDIEIDGSTALGASVAITSGGNTTFRGPVDGNANSLTVTTDADASILAEGSISDVDVVEMTSGAISVRAVTSTGDQTYTADETTISGDLASSDDGDVTIDGDLILGDNSSISALDNNITVTGDVDGAFSFNVAAGGTGDITVGGDVGSGTRLVDMSVISANDVSLRGVRVENFRQVEGTGLTAFDGALDATGDTGVDVTSVRFRFGGPVDIAGNLEVNASDVVRFNSTADIEGNASIAAVTLRIGNDGNDTFDVDGSLLVEADNLFVVAPVTTAGTATFDVGEFTLSSDLETTGGTITVDNSRQFIFDENGSITLNGNDFRQIGDGVSILSQGIDGEGSLILFEGPIQMEADLSFRGQTLTFNGAIDSDDALTPRALTLNANQRTTIAGPVGLQARIGSLNTDAGGRTVLSSEIRTAGPVRFGDSVLVEGEAIVDSRAGGANGDIEFAGAIDSRDEADPGSLTVLVDETILDHTLPTITFRRSIGAEAPLDNLRLNFREGVVNGREGVTQTPDPINGVEFGPITAPLVSTIVIPLIEYDPDAAEADRGFSINTVGEFVMGHGEKLSVTFNYDRVTPGGFFEIDGDGNHLKNGDVVDASNRPTFRVDAEGGATFGDVLVDGNFTVNSPTIEFITRAGSLILPQAANENTTQEQYLVGQQLETDDGTDVVVNGLATFSVGPSGVASLGTTNLDGFNTANRGSLTLRDLQLSPTRGEGLFTVNDLFMPQSLASELLGLSGDLFLDLRAEGSSGFQPPIFGQIPNESQSGSVNQATAIGSVAKRALADLGINARDPDDLLDALIGRALYNDLVSGEGDASYVTANRMSLDIATDLVNDYQAFFRKQVVDENGNPQFDPETGEAMYEPQAPIIRARLAEAVREYRRQSGGQFDPIAFRQFTQSNEAYAQVEQDLDTLEHLLKQFQILGLSSGEFSQARLALLRLVRPSQGLNDQQFIAVIDAGDGVIEAPAPTPAEPERIIDERLPPAPAVP